MKKTPIALCIASALALSACSTTSVSPVSNLDGSQAVWQAITFGQSTDLNFGSTILPEKVGLNHVVANGQEVQPGPVASQFTIESRGGKIANSHEGGTFYYTELPTDVNFTLSANVTIDQLGPETGSTPNRQEGAGLMVRDILGEARLDPQPQGLEEFPAASNMVMNLVRANKKEHNGLANINASYREGIYQPWGTAGNRMTHNEFIKGVQFGPGKTYHMTLTRTDDGYVVSYDDGTVKQTQEVRGANANIVQMQDGKHQYVGFFASRNAKMTVTDVALTLSNANTVDAPRYQARLDNPVLQQASADQSAIDNYTVQARANYSGTFSVTQNGQLLADKQAVSAGEMFGFPTTLTQASTQFNVTFTPIEGPDLQPLSYQQSVEKVAVNNPMEIRVNPNGTDGRMTLDAAVKLLPPGGTIVLEDGDYAGLTLPVSASGTPEAMKTLKTAGDQVRFVGDYLHQANYWNVSNIEVFGARTIVHGSHNHFSHMVTHGAPDTGFQISSPEKIGRALWASHNTVTDSESFNNMDKSQINADGFAAKMRIGDGNTFIRCASHHNIDDGWDLFNKVEDGANGVVTILDSVAYMNGQTMDVEAKGGTRGNGFKLGGEGLPVAHIVKNSLAYHNNMDGFTDNFNPGALTLENNVAIDNVRFNYLFRKSPYEKAGKQGTFTNNQSYRFHVISQYSDVVNGDTLKNNRFIRDGITVDDQGKAVDLSPLAELKAAALLTETESHPGHQQVEQIRNILNMD
ncbi:right-handed parallel beta-helix repeat-containing protein [Vibrio furnissii]|uniref:right-handed parallel beta-helix repeat-containing protein n=1 Tax=Vibrio furnissii TaxID=29494 RepID=UPI00117FAFE2|nr:exopolygalacturonate lyase [Vibrio furnissii]TRN24444.1 exopolygalacturonate lyase [Vibrio furnissii]